MPVNGPGDGLVTERWGTVAFSSRPRGLESLDAQVVSFSRGESP